MGHRVLKGDIDDDSFASAQSYNLPRERSKIVDVKSLNDTARFDLLQLAQQIRLPIQ